MEPLSALEGVRWFAKLSMWRISSWSNKQMESRHPRVWGVVVEAAAAENWFRAESVLFEYTVFQPLVPGAQAWAAQQLVTTSCQCGLIIVFGLCGFPLLLHIFRLVAGRCFSENRKKNSKFLTDICVHIIKPEWDGSIVTVPTTRCLREPGATVSTTDLFAGQMHTSYACSIDSVWGLKTAAERW